MLSERTYGDSMHVYITQFLCTAHVLLCAYYLLVHVSVASFQVPRSPKLLLELFPCCENNNICEEGRRDGGRNNLESSIQLLGIGIQFNNSMLTCAVHLKIR